MRYFRPSLRTRIVGGPMRHLLAYNLAGMPILSRKNMPGNSQAYPLSGYPSPLRAAMGALFGSAFTSPGPSSVSSSDAFYTYTAPAPSGAAAPASTAVIAATPGPAEYPSVSTLAPSGVSTAQTTGPVTYSQVPASTPQNVLALQYSGTPGYQDNQGPPDWSGPKARVRLHHQTETDWLLILLACAAGYALYKSK